MVIRPVLHTMQLQMINASLWLYISDTDQAIYKPNWLFELQMTDTIPIDGLHRGISSTKCV